ncbi:hypothetical protein [Archangium sp.]|uniref:hypothetical protein n=1 Tax=Archangium sp. TaxID=1872627 RepID=UPI00389B3545
MPSPLRALPCALLAGVLLASPSAEARFGKSSDSSGDSNKSESTNNESKSSDSHVHDATPVNSDSGSSSKPVHEASPVGSGSSRPEHPPSSSDPAYYPPPVYEPGYAPGYVTPRHRGSWEEEFSSRRHRNFTLGLEGNFLREGGGVGVHLGVEGDRLGGFLRATGLSLKAGDGSGGADEISVTEVHLSWALVTGHWGRVRVEGGVAVAKAPDVTFVGPSVGVSAEVYLLNSLALEARTQVTPFPYRQLDAAGGVVWYVGGWRLLALRGGLRVLMLDDAGWVDGVVHQDVLPGPYVAFGLAI